jgi:hypothetical protein
MPLINTFVDQTGGRASKSVSPWAGYETDIVTRGCIAQDHSSQIVDDFARSVIAVHHAHHVSKLRSSIVVKLVSKGAGHRTTI